MKCLSICFRKKQLLEYDPSIPLISEIDTLKMQFSEFENDIRYKQIKIDQLLSHVTDLCKQNNCLLDNQKKNEIHIDHQYKAINHLQSNINWLQEKNNNLERELYKVNTGINIEHKLNTIIEADESFHLKI